MATLGEKDWTYAFRQVTFIRVNEAENKDNSLLSQLNFWNTTQRSFHCAASWAVTGHIHHANINAASSSQLLLKETIAERFPTSWQSIQGNSVSCNLVSCDSAQRRRLCRRWANRGVVGEHMCPLCAHPWPDRPLSSASMVPVTPSGGRDHRLGRRAISGLCGGVVTRRIPYPLAKVHTRHTSTIHDPCTLNSKKCIWLPATEMQSRTHTRTHTVQGYCMRRRWLKSCAKTKLGGAAESKHANVYTHTQHAAAHAKPTHNMETFAALNKQMPFVWGMFVQRLSVLTRLSAQCDCGSVR